MVHLSTSRCVHHSWLQTVHCESTCPRSTPYFGLKFRGEANLSVVTLEPSLNDCMYLSGVVHWFASLLLLLPSLALLVCLFSRRAMAVGKSK